MENVGTSKGKDEKAVRVGRAPSSSISKPETSEKKAEASTHRPEIEKKERTGAVGAEKKKKSPGQID